MKESLNVIFVELQTTSMIIGAAHRVPGTNINDFNETYEQILHTIADESKRIIVEANQNIGLLFAP